jgi:hypothetical protein
MLDHPAANGFDLNGKTPSELEQRRRDIVQSLTTKYRGYDDPDVPIELLGELALITSALRRKNAGPPRRAPARRSRPTVDDL